MIVNLNCLCKVYLNDAGKIIWLSQLDQIDEKTAHAHPELIETIKSMIKEDNSLTTELWDIMSVFGPFISLATCPFSTPTIELQRNPNIETHYIKNITTEVNNNEDS